MRRARRSGKVLGGIRLRAPQHLNTEYISIDKESDYHLDAGYFFGYKRDWVFLAGLSGGEAKKTFPARHALRLLRRSVTVPAEILYSSINNKHKKKVLRATHKLHITLSCLLPLYGINAFPIHTLRQ